MASFFMLFVFACGPKAVAPKAELDTPGHHVSNGNKLLKLGRIDVAYAEFNRAKELDPKYSPAYVGLGLVCGFKGDFQEGLTTMEKADKYAQDKQQQANADIGFMRIYILGREKITKNWLGKVESRYKKAIGSDPDLPEPYYYMGKAYKMAYKFRKAVIQFAKVLDLDKGYIEEANTEYEIVQKIERAMPGSINGKKIALLEKITRADVAALFVEELKIDELFLKKEPKVFDTSYEGPEKKGIHQSSYQNCQ